jgi:FkbH-like protein
MLTWLPQIEDFGVRLRQAVSTPMPERLERLVALCHFRLDFLQTIQLNRALEAIAADPNNSLPRHRLAVIGSTTLDHLAPGIRIAALRRGLWLEVRSGGYGQYRQEILDPQSQIQLFQPQTVLLSIAADHVLPDSKPGASHADTALLIRGVCDDLRSLWQQIADGMQASVIQQTFLDLTQPLFGSYDRMVPASPFMVVEQLNDVLCESARDAGVAVLDLAAASARDGRDAWHEPARMLQAKQEIAPQAVPAYGELIARIVCAQRGLSKKCLVLDLDNTMWGGVLGDDGMQGLLLGQGNPVGEAHLALQRYVRQLKDRGVILAVCSKNDPQLAAEAFDTHPEMLLRRSDIAVFVANWEEKPHNLAAIAARLNIGRDSLVFVDDNPIERARMREVMPEVAVPELPEDVTGYTRCLAEAGYFEATSFTREDQQRSALYSSASQRESARASGASLDQFLSDLQLQLTWGDCTAMDFDRVHQLINKTNQFNPTTRRYAAEQLRPLLNNPGTISLQGRLRDKFGDHGLVTAMILTPIKDIPVRAEIDTWVMSCRVFGLQLEHELMNCAVEAARRAGIQELVARYLPSPKNEVIRELYPRLGFSPLNLPGLEAGATGWSLKLSDYRPHTTHIARSSPNAKQ